MAPSGGRDRKDAAHAPKGDSVVTDFDPKSVELFRLIAKKAESAAKKTLPAGADPTLAPRTHFFTLAMLTRNLVPPPEQTGARDVGEV